MPDVIRYRNPTTIDPDTVERAFNALASTFGVGRYAEAKPSGRSESGKVKLNAWMAQRGPKDAKVPIPFTPTLLSEHLHAAPEALPLRGVYLQPRAGVTRVALIDIDEYDGTLWARVPAMLQTARTRGWPLLPIRTKSGGAHLIALLQDDTPWDLAQQRMKELLSLLDLPSTTETYPNNAASNALWLPYWGAAHPEGCVSCLMGRDGATPQPFDEWVRALEYERTPRSVVLTPIAVRGAVPVLAPLPVLDTEAVARHEVRVDASESVLFPDGPPCLQALEQSGSDGQRTSDLTRAVATYHRLRTSEEDDVAFDVANAMRAMNDRIDLNTAVKRAKDVEKSAAQGKLGYMCRDEPLASRCNRATCMYRRYGVEATPAAEKHREKHAQLRQETVEKEQLRDAKASITQQHITTQASQLIERLGGTDAVRLIAITTDSGESSKVMAYRLVLGPHLCVDLPSVEALNDVERVRNRLQDHSPGGDVILQGVTPKVWKAVTSRLNESREVELVSAETDMEETLRIHYVNYFAVSARQSSLAMVRKHGGWCSEDAFAWYRATDMRRYMDHCGLRLTSDEGRVMMKRLGVQSGVTKRFKHEDGRADSHDFARVLMRHLNVLTLAGVLPQSMQDVVTDASKDDELI